MEKHITRLLRYGTLLSTYALILSVLLQIFARFFLEKAPPWTEEASRLFFIYAIAFASGLAMKSNAYVQLDVMYTRLPTRQQALLDVLIPLLICILFGLITVCSIFFVWLGYPETSPSMGMRMSTAFMSMVVMGGSVLFYAWINAKQAYEKLKS